MEKVDGKYTYVTHIIQKAHKDRTCGFQEVAVPKFQENRHVNVIKLSALRTGRLYLSIKYFGYLFLLEAESNTGS